MYRPRILPRLRLFIARALLGKRLQRMPSGRKPTIIKKAEILKVQAKEQEGPAEVQAKVIDLGEAKTGETKDFETFYEKEVKSATASCWCTSIEHKNKEGNAHIKGTITFKTPNPKFHKTVAIVFKDGTRTTLIIKANVK